MSARPLVAVLLAMLSATAAAQVQPATTPATAPNTGPMGAAVAREVQGLSADDFPQRQAALQHLQTLVADQLKQRAQIQEVLDALQADLVQQEHALALVSDEEAQAQIAGLLEMERGLTGWTIQTMSEPVAHRKDLLNWGLTAEHAPALAQVYADNVRLRLDGVKQLARLNDPGALWTLSRLINDRETSIRAAAMAACWSRSPNEDIVNALWFRAVTGPLHYGEDGAGPRESRMLAEGRVGGSNSIKVDFPDGDTMEFDDPSDANDFFDSQLASDVLVHLNSPLVAVKVKALVAERAQAGKTLSLNSDPDWTLVSHRLVETYGIKEAIPLLAAEALGAESDDMGGDMNGRPFMWSRRTMAIGTLCKLIGKDPADLNLIHARDRSESRGWMWAVDVNPQAMVNGNVGESDGPAVRAFYAFWKDHHAEFGVKEAPSNASVPPVPQPGQGPAPRRFRGQPVPNDAPIPPAPAPASAPATPG